MLTHIYHRMFRMLAILAIFFSPGAAFATTSVSAADVSSAYSFFANSGNNTVSASLTAPVQQSGVQGIGRVADNLMVPAQIIASFIASCSVVVGMTCLFAAFIRYMQHRVNPLAHPISIVFTLLILGLLLLVLPLIYKLTESGLPSFGG